MSMKRSKKKIKKIEKSVKHDEAETNFNINNRSESIEHVNSNNAGSILNNDLREKYNSKNNKERIPTHGKEHEYRQHNNTTNMKAPLKNSLDISNINPN